MDSKKVKDVKNVKNSGNTGDIKTADELHLAEFKFIVEMLLHGITVQMEACMKQFYEAFGLTTAQAMVLLYLRHYGQGKITEVARKLHMTNSNLSTTCRRLEREGLLKRTRDADDQRIVWISLTEACEQRLVQLEEQIDCRYLDNLTAVSEQDREIILAGLMKLKDLLAAESSGEMK